MLALFPGLLAVLGPLLSGAWDLWAQSLLLLAVLAVAVLWVCGRLLRGRLPLPPRPLLAWTLGLAVWGGLCAYAGPLPAYAVPAWHVWLAALGVLLAYSVMPGDQRRLVDLGMRAVAWALVLLALYQRFGLHLDRPPASLLNVNVFAGAILLFLPLAVTQKDWILTALLLLCLTWAHSVGAWLGLAAALLLVRRPGRVWTVAAAVLFCLALAAAKLGTAGVRDRWVWWTAAARMGLARPWLGSGPGTFAYVLPAYVDPSRPLASLYAHQHFLETAAEEGFPFLAAWLAGLWLILRRGPPAKRVAALALLVQSLWDYALSIPAVLWLFCCCVGSCLPESGAGLAVPARWRLPACALALAAGLCAGQSVWQRWQADIGRARAQALVNSGGSKTEALALLEASARRCDHPETARLSGFIEASLSGADGSRLQAAAADFERAAAQNPFRASTWSWLETTYRRLGREDRARSAHARGAASCPSLRGNGPG
ncbi:MAG: O-antigen ligase family protein [Elusimicrobia bacterium]|nr:O-antigen ligase family protein [Elusimicrobiota bacterium]